MNILFVCTGNTCRSPMAEGMLKKMIKDKSGEYSINSGGVYVHPGSKISEFAQTQLKERGIDMAERKAVQITNKQIDDADLVFTMTGSQRRMLVESFPYAADKIHLLGDYTNRGGDISDPIGGGYEAYSKAASEIEEMLGILVKII